MRFKFRLFLIFNLCNLVFINQNYAQIPNCLWAMDVGSTDSENSVSINTDSAGNFYVAGGFSSPTIDFGSITLFNSGSNDIYLAKYSSDGNVIWANSYGGLNYEQCSNISLDNKGNIYITGQFSSTNVLFGSIFLTYAGGNDLFVAKLDSGGNVIWANSIGGQGSELGSGVAADTLGNVYVTGLFGSTSLAIGSSTLTNMGQNDFLIVKYDQNGIPVWAKSTGGSNNEIGRNIVVDKNNNVNVTGEFDGASIIFGSTTLINTGSTNIFLVQYDLNGNLNWAKSFIGNNLDQINGVTVDSTGNIYVAGYFYGSISFDTITMSGWSGNCDVFLAKYDVNGNVVWAHSGGGPDIDYCHNLYTDASGNCYLIGDARSAQLLFGALNINTVYPGTRDFFVVKYDANGIALWAYTAGTPTVDNGSAVATDRNGYIYMTGGYSSHTMSFGTFNITNNSIGPNADIFILKLVETTFVSSSFEVRQFDIFPNPAISYFDINLRELYGNVDLIITDISGKIIYFTKGSPLKLINFNTNVFAEGLYFIQVKSDNFSCAKKLIIQKE